MKAWLDHNLHSFGLALSTFRSQPFASMFSILVIGIALALPAGFYLALANAELLAGGLPAQPEINIFLKPDLDEAAGRALARQLGERTETARVRFVPRDEGLKRLRETGLDELTAGLTGNPLPDAIVLTAKDSGSIDTLATEIRNRAEVDHVSADTDWAKRLAALLDFGRELVLILAILLGLALAAITGNTIRLQIYAAREEIEVSRLIGATDRFIRRPFLYFGTIQGLLGGLAGWAIVSGGLLALEVPLARLATVWGMSLVLQGPGLIETAVLLGTAAGLGFIGAFIAVGRSLGKTHN